MFQFFLCLSVCLIISCWKLDTEVIVLGLKIVTALLLLGFCFMSFDQSKLGTGLHLKFVLPWFSSMQHSVPIYKTLYLVWLVLYKSKICLILNFRFPFLLWFRDSIFICYFSPVLLAVFYCHCNSYFWIPSGVMGISLCSSFKTSFRHTSCSWLLGFDFKVWGLEFNSTLPPGGSFIAPSTLLSLNWDDCSLPKASSITLSCTHSVLWWR